jgi:uncharacterized metal-binding protein YceD (DUF177 family)
VDTKVREKILAQFDVSIVNLLNKKYDYNYLCKADFFECFENSLLTTGNCEVKVNFDKSETMITSQFEIKGTIELICDRSLEPFDFPIDLQEKIFFKFGTKAVELSDDVIIIPHNTQTLNLSDTIFELICLQVPMKKLHPKFADEETDGDEILIYSSDVVEEDETPEEEIDPRWANLKKLLK